jgi:imidazoleglycerol-phosphate dehydratase/histidinol-phosphatase
MGKQKILFIDRDGTLIQEPGDKQVDHINKLKLMPDVISALLQLKKAGFVFVLISNQDGLGTPSFPYENFITPHELMLDIFSSQNIHFEAIRICPHKPEDYCDCRKPKVGLIFDYLLNQSIDIAHSYVIGDRETDMELAKRLGIQGVCIGQSQFPSWTEVAEKILATNRTAKLIRKTKETEIDIHVNLDIPDSISIQTRLRFFDHMLEQLAKHGGFSLQAMVNGDHDIDDHHTIEDTAIVLGQAIRKALGDKWGIGRYGFLLPMDDALTQIALDISGRTYFKFSGDFQRESIGDISLEMIPHFFRSFADGLQATLHIEIKGENVHHMVESIFKGVGRSLRQAIARTDNSLPSTKGVL